MSSQLQLQLQLQLNLHLKVWINLILKYTNSFFRFFILFVANIWSYSNLGPCHFDLFLHLYVFWKISLCNVWLSRTYATDNSSNASCLLLLFNLQSDYSCVWSNSCSDWTHLRIFTQSILDISKFHTPKFNFKCNFYSAVSKII